MVVCNSADTIKEAFLKSEDFSDRGMLGDFFGFDDSKQIAHLFH